MEKDGSAASRSHAIAILQALLVTFLWSTSWVLIKVGLKSELPSLTFAGLRYVLAFLCLAPFILLNPAQRASAASLTRGGWLRLALLGLMLYTLTQGAQFVGLDYLPAATLTLMLSFTPVVVALMSGFFNNEPPAAAQWGGIALTVVGALVYFYPSSIPSREVVGLLVALFGVLANAGAALAGRRVNRQGQLSPLLITTISMGFGGLLLLVVGAATQGFGRLGLTQWAIIVWLAVVNTAVAFTLWNRTLRTLTAVESSIINNLMMPQIALLAWFFLGEQLTNRQILGLALVGIGTLAVQLWRGRAAAPLRLTSSEQTYRGRNLTSD